MLNGPYKTYQSLLITVLFCFFIVVLRVSGGSQRPRRVPTCGGASRRRRAASVRSGGPQRSVNEPLFSEFIYREALNVRGGTWKYAKEQHE